MKRKILQPSGYWFAPLSPETEQIDLNVISVGEHRATLARRSIKQFVDNSKLPYHSPYKFRHGHIQYGLKYSKSIEDFKAISMNVMHSSMEITDEFYSNISYSELRNKIQSLGKDDTTILIIVI